MSSNVMEQVVVGSILGDGSIDKTGIYRETHCMRQEDYLLWKKKIFDMKFNTKMKYYPPKRCDLYISRQPIFQQYRELCYPNGKKIITNKFIGKIGKLAVVIWYFDDGSYNAMTNGIQIHSLCFSYEENQKLQRMLKDRFELNFRIGCLRSRKTDYPYYLFCYGKQTDKFLAFIKKNATFVPKKMTYKMGKFDKRNNKWIKSAQELKKKMDKEYYNENRDKIKKQCNEYYWKNRKERRKKQTEYYINNKEKFKELSIKWRKNNPEKLREIGRRWRKKYPEYYKEYRKRKKLENPKEEKIFKK